ncbi:MAG TPA: MarR family winged helix-turn-helix transcriptional regulator [Polyangiaceae bacterium]
MHEVAFSLKRGHWRCQRYLGALAARHGLTPARFDVLLAAYKMQGYAYQSTIARKLGVRRSTVCKMMRAMEELGILVRLDRNYFDRRFRRWKITEHGMACLTKIMKMIRAGEVARVLYQWIFIHDRAVKTLAAAERIIDDAAYDVQRIAWLWGDPSRFSGTIAAIQGPFDDGATR